MTVIISVKINDGVVMASDSASTFGSGQVYNNAEKVINLIKGLPIGVMVTGHGSIGIESINTILKDYRAENVRFTPGSTYTVEEICDDLANYLRKKELQDVATQMRVCGYSFGRPLSEIRDITIINGNLSTYIVAKEEDWGANWAGDTDALDRLILGRSSVVLEEFVKVAEEDNILSRVNLAVAYVHLAMPAMPIQDAIDLARYLVEVSIGFVKFSFFRSAKSVGGPIEIAAITKHEGFVWVQRKHFFSRQLNETFPRA